MIGIDGNGATLALANHLGEIIKQRDWYAEEIRNWERRRDNLQEDQEEAKARYDTLKAGNTDQLIADLQSQMDADQALEGELTGQVLEYDKVLGNYKEQLARLFDEMHKKSVELNKHCKSKDEDKRHIDAVDYGLTALERQVAVGKEVAAKRQARCEVFTQLEKLQKTIQDNKERLQALVTQKADEEQETQDLQIKLAQIEEELNGILQTLEELYAAKAEIDALLDETNTAYHHIMDSSATLLQCVKREGVILQANSFPTEKRGPSPKHKGRKPRR